MPIHNWYIARWDLLQTPALAMFTISLLMCKKMWPEDFFQETVEEGVIMFIHLLSNEFKLLVGSQTLSVFEGLW